MAQNRTKHGLIQNLIAELTEREDIEDYAFAVAAAKWSSWRSTPKTCRALGWG